jgi:hypothetical protein
MEWGDKPDRWVAFRSHFDNDVFYCQPGVTGAHEKGARCRRVERLAKPSPMPGRSLS